MAKLVKKSKSKKITGADTLSTFMEYIVTLICSAIFILVPLFMKNGYYGIGDAKYDVYKRIVFIGLPVMIVLSVWYIVLTRRQINLGWIRKELSSVDRIMILYAISVCISYALSDFKSEAIMGYPGWNMGLVSQFTFVLLYFFVSRFGKDGKVLLLLLCGVSTVVFTLGVCNRFLIDPLGVYVGIDPRYQIEFLSTLGQSSWYSSFVSTVLPIGCYYFWSAKSTKGKIISGLYCLIGFSTLITQNSDSAYIALACIILGLFCFSVSSLEKLFAFFMLTFLFLFSTRLVNMCTFIFTTEIIEQLDVLSKTLIMNQSIWVVLIINLFILFVLNKMKDKEKQILKVAKVLRILVFGSVIIGIIFSILCLVLSAYDLMPENMKQLTGKIPYLLWDDEWGNKRGFSWRVTWKMFVEMDWKDKIFGVGPECYPYYAYSKYKAVLDTMFKGNVLSNAHNEWYNAMINYGIVGAIFYLGIFITTIKCFAKDKDNNQWLIGILLCATTYVGHNFFCYQQVLCTPFIFIMIGLGEHQIRKNKKVLV